MFVKVENGVHTVKDGTLNGIYKTSLEDGKYNIRKLNLLEIERLQNQIMGVKPNGQAQSGNRQQQQQRNN